MGRMRVCVLCVDNNEQCDRGVGGVGVSVNTTLLSETVVVLEEDTQRTVRFRKNPMNLCVSDSE